jgi:hypothetical protein
MPCCMNQGQSLPLSNHHDSDAATKLLFQSAPNTELRADVALGMGCGEGEGAALHGSS